MRETFVATAVASYIPRLPVRMFVGGLALVGLWRLVGTSALGLGVPMILRSFEDPNLPVYVFALTLEVTPLFSIGAALGGVLGRLLGIPTALGAGVGLAAVFAASSNTPLALSNVAVELVGASVFPHAVVVCVIAYLLTGHRSIYPAQRMKRGKDGSPLVTLARAFTNTFAGIRPADVAGFVIAQGVGAAAATATFRWLVPGLPAVADRIVDRREESP